MAEVRNLIDFDAYDSRRGFRLANRYALTRSIRTTGIGQTYLADDTEAAKQVLVVVHTAPWADDPSRRQLFEARARTLSGLEHANLASLLDHGIMDGRCFAVLERFEGERLADKLVRKSRRGPSGLPMSADEVVPIVSQLLKALEYAHARGVIARCLDPAHVLLCSDGVHTDIVRVVGVGIPELMQNLPVPEETALLGDADFASPEQLRGEPATTQSDVFAVGRLMLAMLQGCPTASVTDALRGSAGGAVPGTLVDFIEACVRPLPTQRPLDAAAMVERLIDAVPNASMFRLPRITGSHSTLTRRVTPAPPQQPTPSAPAASVESSSPVLPTPPEESTPDETPAPRSFRGVLLWSGLVLAVVAAAGAFTLSQSSTTAPGTLPHEATVVDPRPSAELPAASSQGESPPSLPHEAEGSAAAAEPDNDSSMQASENTRPERPETTRRRSTARRHGSVDAPPSSPPRSDAPPPKAPSTSNDAKESNDAKSVKEKEDPFLTPSRRASEVKADLLPSKDGT